MFLPPRFNAPLPPRSVIDSASHSQSDYNIKNQSLHGMCDPVNYIDSKRSWHLMNNCLLPRVPFRETYLLAKSSCSASSLSSKYTDLIICDPPRRQTVVGNRLSYAQDMNVGGKTNAPHDKNWRDLRSNFREWKRNKYTSSIFIISSAPGLRFAQQSRTTALRFSVEFSTTTMPEIDKNCSATQCDRASAR